MRLLSWNVNGLRACLGKGFADSVSALNCDVICLQETKMEPHQADIPLDGYEILYNSAEKKGYSGTAVLTREKYLSSTVGIGIDEHDHEGRVITVEFQDFFLVNCYTPNSQNELARLPYRQEWDAAFRAYVSGLAEKKPVVFCGDLNVAHQEIDLARPDSNHFSAGFSDEEREGFTQLLGAGFADTFRSLHPDARDAYSWWSFRGGARARNVGWRIDYFCVSERMLPQVKSASIHADITGSDHCPVSVEIDA